MGGEKFDNPKIDNSQLGSPPHGRGKGGKVIFNQLPRGITPAWAGKSSVISAIKQKFKDHPRMGGEKPKVL